MRKNATTSTSTNLFLLDNSPQVFMWKYLESLFNSIHTIVQFYTYLYSDLFHSGAPPMKLVLRVGYRYNACDGPILFVENSSQLLMQNVWKFCLVIYLLV